MRFELQTLTGETRYVQLELFKILLFVLQILLIVFFSICIIYSSETSLNVSHFDQQDFVKIQNFEGYDVIMTY